MLENLGNSKRVIRQVNAQHYRMVYMFICTGFHRYSASLFHWEIAACFSFCAVLLLILIDVLGEGVEIVQLSSDNVSEATFGRW